MINIILVLSLNFVLFAQSSQEKHHYKNDSRLDTIYDLLKVHVRLLGPISSVVEKGDYKVLEINEFDDFYLIFVEKLGVKFTIYSDRILNPKGQKISVGNTYYLELICKDILYNGQCLPIIPDVTYFNKFKGYELGKLYIAKNLMGLFLIETNDGILKED